MNRPFLAGVSRNNYKRYLLLVALSLFLVSCGFKLRGGVEIPAAMERTYLQGVNANSSLEQDIHRALRAAGGKLVSDQAAASSILTIIDWHYLKTVIGVDSRGKASEYELRLTLRYSLHDGKQNLLVDEQAVSVTRQLLFDSANVLGMATEEEALRRDMQRLAVRQMINRLRIELK